MICFPILTVFVPSIFTVSTATGAFSTVKSTKSVNPPSNVVTVIVVLPADNAVTLPSLLTVATDSLEELHVTDLSTASDGTTSHA